MNGRWKNVSIVLAFVVQLGVLFFWGGSIDNKVERLQVDMTQMRGSYSDVSESVSDLQLRVGVIEEVGDMCVELQEQRVTGGNNGE